MAKGKEKKGLEQGIRTEPVPYRKWGTDLEPSAVQQLVNACSLPIAVAGALMPDAHQGYGLPIGGVLATKDAVIPYAVGVDIACRMKMSILDTPPSVLDRKIEQFKKAIQQETRFGIGAIFKNRRNHEVMDRDWSFSKLIRGLKDKAHSQLGTSGSGNHFVEFGILTLDVDALGLPKGCYLALLSHSGSRGTGASIAQYYSQVAMGRCKNLPKNLRHLAWLEMSSAEGQQYWKAMQLMGCYAQANHYLIHRHIIGHLGMEVMVDLENHHNFAWKETYGGHPVIVHRKGATPAGKGILGIIPGSMGTSGYIARGKGCSEALESAAHGAGRRMSRKAAKKQFSWADAKRFLDQRGVIIMSAGLDEVPMAYKDIEEVMRAQRELVEPIARFDPKLVKMAAASERPED